MFLQTFDSRQSMVAVLWVWHSVQRLGDCLHLCVEDRLDIAITAIAARRKKSLKDVNSYIPIKKLSKAAWELARVQYLKLEQSFFFYLLAYC